MRVLGVRRSRRLRCNYAARPPRAVGTTPSQTRPTRSLAQTAQPPTHPPPQGVDIYDTKFNIVSPGADADIYFPFSDAPRRLTTLHGELKVGRCCCFGGTDVWGGDWCFLGEGD